MFSNKNAFVINRNMKNKMLSRNLLLVLMSMFMVSVFGQNATYTVKGVLLDSLTQEGEPYATIKIATKQQADKAVKMAVTDMKGQFKESFSATPGEYLIQITSIGKAPIVRAFSLQPTNRTVDLGTLYSSEATNELGAVEIVAQKPLVKADIDKIEYNVQDDPDAQTNSVLEMLRKVPLVTVDGEDNIQVNGSSSFKVHVNGKLNQSMSNNPSEILKSIPANAIKHIEVITNPGAKYDAEGIGGILNIVMITGGAGVEGYTATLSAGLQNSRETSSLYATVKKNKFTLSVNYSINHNRPPKSYNESSQDNLNAAGEVESNIGAYSTSKSNRLFQFGNVEASYEIDTLNLISFSAGLFGGSNDSNQDGEYRMDAFEHGNTLPVYQYETRFKSDNSWYNVRGNVDYQHTSRTNKDRFFTLSYLLSIQPQNSDGHTNYLYDDAQLSPEWQERLLLQDFRTNGKQQNAEHTFQADYTTPIAKITTLEFGAKYIIRNNTSKTWRYEQQAGGDDYQFNEKRSSHYKHLNDILAAYLGYSVKINRWNGKAGVRYEHTMQHVKYLVGQGDDFKVNFNDWVPSVTIGYKITDMSNIKLGYNMRIFRPGIWYLNPYINDQNPNYVTKGNPDLKSEKSNTLELTYSNFTQKFNINISAQYRFNNNGIESYTRLIKSGTMVPELDNLLADHDFLFQTYENIGKSKNATLNGYFNWNASPKTRVYANASVSYIDLKSPGQDLHNSGWNTFVSGGVQHTFPWEIRATLNGMYASPQVNLQGKGNDFYNYSLSLNRSFLKEKRLTVSLFCSNIFTSDWHFKQNINGENFRQFTDYSFSARRYGFSVSYRLGSLRASVQKAKRAITNDDVKGGGEDGNSGGGSN